MAARRELGQGSAANVPRTRAVILNAIVAAGMAVLLPKPKLALHLTLEKWSVDVRGLPLNAGTLPSDSSDDLDRHDLRKFRRQMIDEGAD